MRLSRNTKSTAKWTPRPTIDVCLSEEFAEYATKAFEDAEKGRRGSGVRQERRRISGQGGKPDRVGESLSAYCPQVTRSPLTHKSFQWPAATLNPAKLCYSVHQINLSMDGYDLFTHAPVTSVTPVDETSEDTRANGLSKSMDGLSVNGNASNNGHSTTTPRSSTTLDGPSTHLEAVSRPTRLSMRPTHTPSYSSRSSTVSSNRIKVTLQRLS